MPPLCATAPDWLPPLFPQARLSFDRRTLRCADLSGRSPRKEGSCIIHLKGPRAGWGYDHATGESAGPIDLIYQATGLTSVALFEEAARIARMGQPVATRAPTVAKPDHALEVARILGGCQPVANSVAEAYLASRGLADPACDDLKYHPDLTDFETRRGWPGLVAIVRDAAGQPTGGIHRTFLLDDGSGKAPPGKKMLGPVAGGCVRLAAMLEPGEEIQTSDPADSGATYEPFQYRTLLQVSAALGVPYAYLSNDMLKANYSNSRLALLEFRRRIEAYQHAVMVWQLCRQVWARWMDMAVMAGAIDLTAYENRRRDYLSCSWLPPKWDWVDPMKDARAEIEQIGAGLKSRTQALAERGFDAEQVDAEIAADWEREKSLGLVFASVSQSAPAPTEPAADPSSN